MEYMTIYLNQDFGRAYFHLIMLHVWEYRPTWFIYSLWQDDVIEGRTLQIAMSLTDSYRDMTTYITPPWSWIYILSDNSM